MEAFGVARGWEVPQFARAKRISYRCIWAESDWLNLANPSVPESLDIQPNDGFGTDKDSTGLYQQRARWWGDVAGSMDPYVATTRFWEHTVRNTPAWYGTDESVVCQRTQGSQFDGVTIDPKTGKPYPYAANYVARGTQTDAVAADVLFFTHTSRSVTDG